MDVFTAFALIMLVVVGYSAGVTAAGRGKVIPPTIVDLLAVLVIWVAAFSLRNAIGHWFSLLVWSIVAVSASGALTAVRYRQTPVRARPAALPADLNPRQRLWQGWKQFAQEMGNFQGRLLMGFFYFIFVTPFGLVMRLSSDPLRLRPPRSGSAWQARQPGEATLPEGRRQG